MKLLILVLFFPLLALAESPIPGGVQTVLSIIAPYLESYSAQYPWLGNILSIMVTARLVMKPLMSALLQISKDTQFGFLKFLEELSDSKVYKIVAYILDWVLSIKLPKKK